METETIQQQEASVTGASFIIDESNFDYFLNAFGSNDAEATTLARLQLEKCDVEKSIYWIWKLARKHGPWRLLYLRTKASREFNEKAQPALLGSLNPETFCDHLAQKKWLTPKILKACENDIKNRIIDRANSKYFDVELKLKPEYKNAEYNLY